MPIIWLTPDQLEQIEELLWTSFLASHGKKREELRKLHTMVAELLSEAEHVRTTDKLRVDLQDMQLVRCAKCGQFFLNDILRNDTARIEARYCSPRCLMAAKHG